MAQTIGTNVVADEDKFIKPMSEILNFLEKAYLNSPNNKRQALMRELANYYKLHGEGSISYSLVPEKFSKEIEQKLEEMDVPFTVLAGADANQKLIIVRDIDAELLTDLEHDIFSQSTDFYMQQTPEAVVNSAEKFGAKKVTELSFADHDAFLFMQQKLYQEGIVSGVLEAQNADEKNPTLGIGTNNLAIKGKIYIPDDKVFNTKGDITDAELQYAAMQAANGHEVFGNVFDARKEIARVDNEQLTAFAKAIHEGQSAVLGDVSGNSKTYLQARNGEVFLYQSDGNGKWNEAAKLKIGQDADITAIKSFITKQADAINNMACLSTKTWTEKFRDNPNINLKEIKAETGEPKYGDFKLRGTVYRNHNAKDGSHAISHEINTLLQEVTKEANNRVLARSDYSIMTKQDKKAAKNEAIMQIFEDKQIPAFKAFQDAMIKKYGFPPLSKEDKEKGEISVADKFVNSIAEHFGNTNENSRDEVAVKTVDVDNKLKAQVKNEMENTKNKLLDVVKNMEDIETDFENEK